MIMRCRPRKGWKYDRRGELVVLCSCTKYK
nr:MAG TPA: hypothetical protein [Caudoviricetes sp.]